MRILVISSVLVLALSGCDLFSPEPEPAALAFTVQPGGAAGGSPFATQPVIEVRDKDGNVVTTAEHAVTIELATNPAGGALTGTLTVTTVAGGATFTDLAIDRAGTGYALVASLGSITATSNGFDVLVGVPVALRFATQVQGAWDNGAPFDSQPGVEVVDAGGNRVTTGAESISLTIGTNPSGGTLAGATTRGATAGIATFTDLSVNRSGAGYTLVASAPGRSSATSAPFTVRRWTGQIQLAVTTTGLNFDPDGYTVRVDQEPTRALPTNGTALLDSLPPGDHHLSLGGAAFNCTLADTATTVALQSGQTAQVAVAATCRRYLSNEVLISSDQFGPGPSEVVVMNPDGSAKTRLTTRGGVSATASRDGLTIAFANNPDASGFGIYLMGADGVGVRKLVQRSTFDGSPAWSPDGTRLAFRSHTDGPYGAYGRIWIVNADGTGLRQVSPDADPTSYVYDDSPSWFPDGHRLLYNRSGDLYIVDVDLGVVSPVAIPDSFLTVHPSRVSPDGSKIAFVSTTTGSAGNYDLFVADADGSNIVRLTTDLAQDDLPVWSPSGRQLLFARVANGKFQIYIVDVAVGGGTSLGPLLAWSESPSDWATAK